MDYFRKTKNNLFAIAALAFLAFAATSQAEVPQGVFSIANKDKQPQDEVLANPNVVGITIRQDWAKLEPTEGIFDFTFLDSAVFAASAGGKKDSPAHRHPGGQARLGHRPRSRTMRRHLFHLRFDTARA